MSLCPIVMAFTLYRLSHILIYRRYRKWKLGNDIELIARCEHDAVGYGPKDELQYINVKALSEWDSKVRLSVRGGTGVISIGQCDDAGVYGPNRPIHPCVITLPQSFKVPTCKLCFSLDCRGCGVEGQVGQPEGNGAGHRTEEQRV